MNTGAMLVARVLSQSMHGNGEIHAVSDVVQCQRSGEVLIVTINHPPVNPFSHAVRSELAAAIEATCGDDGIRAVVLAGAGKLFTGGADVREFGKPRQPSSPAASVQRLGRY